MTGQSLQFYNLLRVPQGYTFQLCHLVSPTPHFLWGRLQCTGNTFVTDGLVTSAFNPEWNDSRLRICAMTPLLTSCHASMQDSTERESFLVLTVFRRGTSLRGPAPAKAPDARQARRPGTFRSYLTFLSFVQTSCIVLIPAQVRGLDCR